jgi:hypothetical protein
VVLLGEISGLVRDVKCEWVINRVHFNPKFGKTSYNTYTNGALRSREGHQIQSIIEVKKAIRFHEPSTVQLQETAEVIGWILQGSSKLPDFKGR